MLKKLSIRVGDRGGERVSPALYFWKTPFLQGNLDFQVKCQWVTRGYFGCRIQIWSLICHISPPSASSGPPKSKFTQHFQTTSCLQNSHFPHLPSGFQVSFSSSFQIFTLISLWWLVSTFKLLSWCFQVSNSCLQVPFFKTSTTSSIQLLSSSEYFHQNLLLMKLLSADFVLSFCLLFALSMSIHKFIKFNFQIFSLQNLLNLHQTFFGLAFRDHLCSKFLLKMPVSSVLSSPLSIQCFTDALFVHFWLHLSCSSNIQVSKIISPPDVIPRSVIKAWAAGDGICDACVSLKIPCATLLNKRTGEARAACVSCHGKKLKCMIFSCMFFSSFFLQCCSFLCSSIYRYCPSSKPMDCRTEPQEKKETCSCCSQPFFQHWSDSKSCSNRLSSNPQCFLVQASWSSSTLWTERSISPSLFSAWSWWNSWTRCRRLSLFYFSHSWSTTATCSTFKRQTACSIFWTSS